MILRKMEYQRTIINLITLNQLVFLTKDYQSLQILLKIQLEKKRSALKIFPVFKKVDTCAAEFKSFTPYMYSTYQRNFGINY